MLARSDSRVRFSVLLFGRGKECRVLAHLVNHLRKNKRKDEHENNNKHENKNNKIHPNDPHGRGNVRS